MVTDAALIKTDTLTSENGQNININADTVVVDDRSFVLAQTTGEGDSGDININAHQVSVFGAGDGLANDDLSFLLRLLFGGIFTSASSVAEGNGGDINVVADDILLDGQRAERLTGFSTSALPGSTTDAGNIRIHTDSMTIIDGGLAATSSFGPGDAGRIEIDANDILIDGGSFIRDNGLVTGIGGTGEETGAAGEIVIRTDTLDISGTGRYYDK